MNNVQVMHMDLTGVRYWGYCFNLDSVLLYFAALLPLQDYASRVSSLSVLQEES